MEKTRVLVVDKDIRVCKLISDNTDVLGNIRIDTIYYEEDLVSCLSEIYYDIVIVDKNLISESQIEAISKNNPDRKRHIVDTEIILTSDEIVCDTVVRIGKLEPMFMIKKPFDFAFIEKLITQIAEMHRIKTKLFKLTDYQTDLDEIIKSALIDIGIGVNMNGFNYLHTAISAGVENPLLLEYITKDLYTEIAKAHHVSVAKVEKSIRDAIFSAWERADTDVLTEYFGNMPLLQNTKPSNSVFIKTLINKTKEIIKSKSKQAKG